MSPIKDIIAIDPNLVDWQDWKPGGGNDSETTIQQTYEAVRDEIRKTGAAKLIFEGVDPAFGSTAREAESWSRTLRRRFGDNDQKVGIRTIIIDNEKVELNIKLK